MLCCDWLAYILKKSIIQKKKLWNNILCLLSHISVMTAEPVNFQHTIFILINAPEALQFTSPNMTFFRQKCGQNCRVGGGGGAFIREGAFISISTVTIFTSLLQNFQTFLRIKKDAKSFKYLAQAIFKGDISCCTMISNSFNTISQHQKFDIKSFK